MDRWQQLIDASWVNLYLVPGLIKFAIAVAIFVLGRWIAKFLVKMVERIMARAIVDPMLIRFVSNILYMLLFAAVIIAALEQVGVHTTSLMAILGAAGLAVGLALKDSLSNFASGVMLILFRPFRVGDFIEAAGTSGVVEFVGIFNTNLRTGDNRQIVVPNAKIYGDSIVNVSAKPTRRIDLVFGIGYDDDIKKAKLLIEAIMQDEKRILSEPAATVMVAELAESSVHLNVRPWVKKEDYWEVHCYLLEQVKLAFDEQGISIPYPQRDVHLHQSNCKDAA